MVHLAVKLLALLSFVGGPLFWTDVLKTRWGQVPAFIACFAPVGLLGLCALVVLDEDEPTPVNRLFAWSGILAGAMILGADFAAEVMLWTGAHHPNRYMIHAGNATGLLVVVLYSVLSIRFLRRELD